MSVSDLSSEQTGPNLHRLIHSLLICVILQVTVHVTMHVRVHSLPEVLHRDIKWSCHLNTPALTRTVVPNSALSMVATAALGATAQTKPSCCPLLPVSARRDKLQIHLIYLLQSSGTTSLACCPEAEPDNWSVALVGQWHHGNS